LTERDKLKWKGEEGRDMRNSAPQKEAIGGYIHKFYCVVNIYEAREIMNYLVES